MHARGYKSDQIKSLFYKAISRAEQYSGPTNSTKNDHTSVIFHLPFHPNDPPSYKMQQAWRETIASKRYHMPLPNMRNLKTIEKCNIECMIIAYSRPMNIGKHLSYRNLNAANFEQLQDLIEKECDKRDRKYARLEDKCNKLEQQVTQKDQQKNMPQRGRSPNHEEPGASKKNKSNQRNTIKQQRTRPKSVPINNSGPKS